MVLKLVKMITHFEGDIEKQFINIFIELLKILKNRLISEAK